MKLVTEYTSDMNKAWISQSLVMASRWFSLGMLLSGVPVLFFLLWHSPHFHHPQNFSERHITHNYYDAILCEVGLIVFSVTYMTFSRIRWQLGWIRSHFTFTSLFLGFSIPVLATHPWYYFITQEDSHIARSLLLVAFTFLFELIIGLQFMQNEKYINEKIFSPDFLAFFVLPLVLFVISAIHYGTHAEKLLQKTYQEAKAFPKTFSYSKTSANVVPYKFGVGSVIPASRYTSL